MSLDFNKYEPKKLDLIPGGTTATVHMTVRHGNAGEGDWLRTSKDGGSEAIDAEFVVLDGLYAKRKFWTLFTVVGTTEGHREAADISGRKLRTILESARGIMPDDKSDKAKEARRVTSYGDFDGLSFVARIAVEKGKNGREDRNVFGRAITPNEKAWHAVKQEAKPAAAPSAPAKPASTPAPIPRPQWAS
jgi:hypothetical protein